ncbi:hypothetical protein FRC01_006519 [Tulasnella sp. 417]|nr:hypothetical protein FRC01_006519 [Tulasnella sp. 417]
MKEVASALAYMHGKGIIHGDLTEKNVAIDHNCRAFLTNFEFSTTEEDAKEGPLIWADLRYLAPEVPWSGWLKTTRGDVYAYGVLILEIASGKYARREDAEDPTAPSTNDEDDVYYFPDSPPDYYSDLRGGSSNVLWGVIRNCTKLFLHRPSIEDIRMSLDDIRSTDWVSRALTR